MKNYNVKKKGFKFSRILKIFLIVLLAAAAIKLGTVGGDMLYRSDKKIIRSIEVETYRSTLNLSLPIIDTIYNSGKISISFSGQIKGLIKDIFHFDLNSPVTILSAQSPYFYSYYVGDYKRHLAQGQSSEPYFYIAELETPDGKDVENKDKENPVPEPTSPASSIFYGGEDDRESTPDNSAITHNKIAFNYSGDTRYKDHIEKLIKDKIDIDKLMKEPLKFSFDKKGPKVLIYHTHTNEGYLKDLSQLDKKGIPSRTTDARYSVVRVGEELAQIFRKKYGIEVIHNATIHNYPNDNVAYGKSLNTATSILKSYPSIRLVLDIHRDGLDDKKLRIVNKVHKKDVAKIMFVIGTDTRFNHPNWLENMKLAIKLQNKLNEKYPGLARPIYISHNRYNQHLGNGSLIVEIGGDGNTIDECMESTKYLAEVINETINNK